MINTIERIEKIYENLKIYTQLSACKPVLFVNLSIQQKTSIMPLLQCTKPRQHKISNLIYIYTKCTSFPISALKGLKNVDNLKIST